MIQEKLRSIIENFGFKEFGFAPLGQPLSLNVYKDWIQNQLHGEMSYLERHLEIKEKPELHYPKLKSAIVFRFHYFPSSPDQKFPLNSNRVALYAQGKDYHDHLKAKLKVLVEELQTKFPGEEFDFHTDSGPVLERDLAYQAGLGWFGKNTCLIDSKAGSLFFIAEILTSLELPRAQLLHPDRCGKCTRCLDACPTDALSEDRGLDANKCISYLTIEKKGHSELGLRENIGDWLFGCDLCQTVCPWNEKVFGKGAMADEVSPLFDREKQIEELRMILNSTDSELKEIFKATPLLRSKAKGLRRNAIVVATNQKLKELHEDIAQYASDPYLSELVSWSLERL